jgi:hypothetical protein
MELLSTLPTILEKIRQVQKVLAESTALAYCAKVKIAFERGFITMFIEREYYRQIKERRWGGGNTRVISPEQDMVARGPLHF